MRSLECIGYTQYGIYNVNNIALYVTVIRSKHRSKRHVLLDQVGSCMPYLLYLHRVRRKAYSAKVKRLREV